MNLFLGRPLVNFPKCTLQYTYYKLCLPRINLNHLFRLFVQFSQTHLQPPKILLTLILSVHEIFKMLSQNSFNYLQNA